VVETRVMKDFIRRYWHIATALVAASWIAGSAGWGWADMVNTHVKDGLTRNVADQTYVRQDVQSVQLERIEAELRALNDKFEMFVELFDE
jgi:hypothetical protein